MEHLIERGFVSFALEHAGQEMISCTTEWIPDMCMLIEETHRERPGNTGDG